MVEPAARRYITSNAEWVKRRHWDRNRPAKLVREHAGTNSELPDSRTPLPDLESGAVQVHGNRDGNETNRHSINWSVPDMQNRHVAVRPWIPPHQRLGRIYSAVPISTTK